MLLEFIDADGNVVQVTANRPLPTLGGGGGMSPDDFNASAPLSWDAETQTLTVDLSDYAKEADVPTTPGDIGAATEAQGEKADSAVQSDDLAPYAKTADLALSDASVAANVATGGTVDDVIASLIAAGLMASA